MSQKLIILADCQVPGRARCVGTGSGCPAAAAGRWGRPMRYWARFRWAAAVALLVAASSTRAHALDMPSPFVQEVLIKSILVTLNDAVAIG